MAASQNGKNVSQKREDSSKDRTAEWRGRKNKTSQNGGNSGKRSVTLGDASVTQCDAMRRPRVEKIREEEREKRRKSSRV